MMTPDDIRKQLRLKREERQAPTKSEAIEMPVHRIEIGDPNGYHHEQPPMAPESRRRVNGNHPQKEERPLPASMDAEKGVLGSILLAPQRCMMLAERTIGKNFFHHPTHAEIWEALTEMHQDCAPIDLISLTQYLEDTGSLARVGGPAYVTELFTFVPTATNIPYYLEIVREKYALRQVAQVGQELAFDALNGGNIPVIELISKAQDSLQSLQSLGRNGNFPDFDDISTLMGENLPPAPPELIRGLLHQGSKIIIGGTSKGRKTFSLIDLAISVATGKPWWGFETTQGKVCYLNFEIQKPFFARRCEDICRAIGAKPAPGQLMIWTLRGMVEGIEKMSDMLIKSLVQYDFSLIIVDPIYKALGDRDENKAGDVASLCNELERIAVRTGAAIAFGAHYSKGNQAAKESIDRIGGSGVFARDPDSILTMTAHQEEDCFTVEATLRNFPPLKPFVVRWDWPLFTRNEILDPDQLKQPKRASRGASGQFESKFSENDIYDILQKTNDGRKPTEILNIAKEQIGMKERTFWNLWKKLRASRRVFEKQGRWFTSIP